MRNPRTMTVSATGGLILASCMILAGPANASHPGDLNCDDFDSQAAAQAHYREHPGDPDGLDANDNGVACENNPGYPDPARDEAPLEDEPPADTTPEEGEEEDPITMPEGGVATGAGGTAGDNDNAELLRAGGVVLTVGAAGVLLIGRRNARD